MRKVKSEIKKRKKPIRKCLKRIKLEAGFPKELIETS